MEATGLKVHYAMVGRPLNKIIVEMEFTCEKGLRHWKIFTATTDDFNGIDEAQKLEGIAKWIALYKLVAVKIDDEIEKWTQIF